MVTEYFSEDEPPPEEASYGARRPPNALTVDEGDSDPLEAHGEILNDRAVIDHVYRAAGCVDADRTNAPVREFVDLVVDAVDGQSTIGDDELGRILLAAREEADGDERVIAVDLAAQVTAHLAEHDPDAAEDDDDDLLLKVAERLEADNTLSPAARDFLFERGVVADGMLVD